MKIAHYTDAPAAPVAVPGACDVTIRWLVGPNDHPPTFHLRRFEVGPGGCSPRHRHPWEHEVYVLEGRGTVWTADGEVPVGPGSFVLVRPDEEHQFRAAGDGALSFLCLIPVTAAY